jgi:hypothetical protein
MDAAMCIGPELFPTNKVAIESKHANSFKQSPVTTLYEDSNETMLFWSVTKTTGIPT